MAGSIASDEAGRSTQPGADALRQPTQSGVDGIKATLLARGRGQAPKPRSGASKTPGLRSDPGQKIIGSAVACPPSFHRAARSSRPGGDAATGTSGNAGDDGKACIASNATGAK